MSEAVLTGVHPRESVPGIITASGGGRAGKGTALAHLKNDLEQRHGKRVTLIDQGVKFRAMGEVATIAGQSLEDEEGLDNFIRSDKAHEATLSLLDEVAEMDEASVKARLYTPEASKAAGKVGKVSSAHTVAVGLMRSQVEAAAAAKADVVLIDGRSIEKYAQEYHEEGWAKFVVGWFFRCEPTIAARRSLGLFEPFDSMSLQDRSNLLQEILNISDRNHSDAKRQVDPLREPVPAYHIDPLTYDVPPDGLTPYGRASDILQKGKGMAVIDTSYTASIAQMTKPVTELSEFALMRRGVLRHEDVGIQTIRSFAH